LGLVYCSLETALLYTLWLNWITEGRICPSHPCCT